MSEKTEQPTRRRLEDARKKGQLARSKVLSSAAVTAVALTIFVGRTETLFGQLRRLTELTFLGQVSPSRGMELALTILVGALAAPIGAAMLVALLVSFAFTGFRPGGAELGFKLERLNPAEGFKRIFSAKSMLEVLKSLGIAVLVSLFVFICVRSRGPAVLRLVRDTDGVAALLPVVKLVSNVLVGGAFFLVVFGGGDFFLQKHHHLKGLMMTREEVKREHKESEGDPHHKAKRRSMQRQISQGGPARGVQKATVIVVNPTHIAIALRYDEAECEAPYLVAKARDDEAMAIRREASTNDIPIVRDIPLARSLIHYDVGEAIPEELYQAAATVLKLAFDAMKEPPTLKAS